MRRLSKGGVPCSRTSTFAITGGASVTNNVVNVITGLWARYPLMVTAEPDVNASSKQADSGKPDIDCLFVLPIIPSSFFNIHFSAKLLNFLSRLFSLVYFVITAQGS